LERGNGNDAIAEDSAELRDGLDHALNSDASLTLRPTVGLNESDATGGVGV